MNLSVIPLIIPFAKTNTIYKDIQLVTTNPVKKNAMTINGRSHMAL